MTPGSDGPERAGRTPLGPGDHVGCVRCGYDLAGIPDDGVCPECGTAAALSRGGGLLVYSAPEYVERLKLGVSMALAWVIVHVLGVVGILAGSGWLITVLLIGSLGLLVGWWWFGAPDPRLGEMSEREFSRRCLRGGVVAHAVLVVGVVASGAASMVVPAAAVLELALLLGVLGTGVVLCLASLGRTIALAPRIPDAGIAGLARRVWRLGLLMVVLPVTVAVGASMGAFAWVATRPALRGDAELAIVAFAGVLAVLGMLIVVMMYVELLRRVREALGRVILDQAERGRRDGRGLSGAGAVR